MTIEILKQESCGLESLAQITASLGWLPHDSLPGVHPSLKREALTTRLANDWASDRAFFWLGREDGTNTGVAILKRLDWDSEVLGISCASLTIYLSRGEKSSRQATASLLIHQALIRCRMDNIQFVSTKISSDQFAEIHALEDSGFRLMDTEMVLRFHGQPSEPQPLPGINFGLRSREEIPGLATMGQLFRHSRFFADPRISEDKAAKLWQASVKDSCLGHADSFLVAMENSSAQGFVTFIDNKELEALGGPSIRSFFHVGVEITAQGRGVGTALIQAATFESRQFDHILVETQSRNNAALCLYQKCGFRIIESRFAFHLWLG